MYSNSPRERTLPVGLLAALRVDRPRTAMVCPTSIRDDLDLPDAALDFDPDLVRGAVVGRAEPVSVLLPEPTDVDFADAAMGLRINSRIRRNANGGFSDAAVDADVVTVPGDAPQIHIELADPHVHFHAVQFEASQIEPRLARAEMESKIHRDLLVELQIPTVFRAAHERGVVVARLFDD